MATDEESEAACISGVRPSASPTSGLAPNKRHYCLVVGKHITTPNLAIENDHIEKQLWNANNNKQRLAKRTLLKQQTNSSGLASGNSDVQSGEAEVLLQLQ